MTEGEQGNEKRKGREPFGRTSHVGLDSTMPLHPCAVLSLLSNAQDASLNHLKLAQPEQCIHIRKADAKQGRVLGVAGVSMWVPCMSNDVISQSFMSDKHHVLHCRVFPWEVA